MPFTFSKKERAMAMSLDRMLLPCEVGKTHLRPKWEDVRGKAQDGIELAAGEVRMVELLGDVFDESACILLPDYAEIWSLVCERRFTV
jgi:hypothetical protein